MTSPETTHHIAHVNGLRMHFVQAGTGEPLVLLHGFPETSYAWRHVIPQLAAHFRVIAPDLRGCGDTDRPTDNYDKRSAAADVYALVRHLGLSSIQLADHDWHDGRLCLRLGLEEMYDATKEPRMWHLTFFDAPNGLAESLIAGRERLFVEHFMRQQACQPQALDDCIDEYARRLAAPALFTAGSNTFALTKSMPSITGNTPARD